jgi:hypothetical protein
MKIDQAAIVNQLLPILCDRIYWKRTELQIETFFDVSFTDPLRSDLLETLLFDLWAGKAHFHRSFAIELIGN